MIRNLHNSGLHRVHVNGNAGYTYHYDLQPADRIIEPIFQTGFSKHHSIYLGIDQDGNEWIAENHKVHGVRLVKASNFFKSGQDYKVERFVGTYPDREQAVKRALKELGRPYDLVSYNCEHYATYVQSGIANSKQLSNTVGLVLALLLIGFIASE